MIIQRNKPEGEADIEMKTAKYEKIKKISGIRRYNDNS
jgi:hypothetical protein